MRIEKREWPLPYGALGRRIIVSGSKNVGVPRESRGGLRIVHGNKTPMETLGKIAETMYQKCCYLGLDCDGACGEIVLPLGATINIEIVLAYLRAWQMEEIFSNDILSPDIGFGPVVTSYLIEGMNEIGLDLNTRMTGKPVNQGGVWGKSTSTADAAFTFILSRMPHNDLLHSTAGALIHGAGAVGGRLARKMKLNFPDKLILMESSSKKFIVHANEIEEIQPKEFIRLKSKCNSVFICSKENVFTPFDLVSYDFVAELANNPVTFSSMAEAKTFSDSKYLVIPATCCNGGGLLFSYLENHGAPVRKSESHYDDNILYAVDVISNAYSKLQQNSVGTCLYNKLNDRRGLR